MNMEREAAESLFQVAGSEGSNPNSPDGSDLAFSEAVTRVKKLIFRRMLVGIKDGRFSWGPFTASTNRVTSFFRTRWSIGALAGARLLRRSSAASVSFSSLALVVSLAMLGVPLKNN